ncbi:hypothetical protein GCM10018790_12880 [Kitasatospora xanthocidica]|uniref:hypothetical protein n=1 Tax=Kitasatospora xanthocidica TaxID=83382 RepID=UPI001678D37E|nr:hypothetical protein [Kitasatospora xanthocidica]GHF36681.1 hypothetical protein GCM10018790_12880 [Kitasatospora xanthocidica]
MTATVRGLLLAAGLAVIGYGLYGLLGDPYITDPVEILVWALGGLVIHDGLWVPLVCLLGAFLVRGPVLRGWLVVAAAVTAVGLPAVLRADDDHGNPSVLPLPYLRNWLLVLAATAGVALLLALAGRWRRRDRAARHRPRPVGRRPRPVRRRAPREDPS